jgi:hypothetical protein
MKNLIERWNAKTPNFWKNVQKIGLAAGAIGTILVTAPISLPASLVVAGGYLVTAGGITATLAQFTKEDADTEQH